MAIRQPVLKSLLVTALLAGSGIAQPVDVYSRPVHFARSHNYDVIHYRIELRFDEATRSFDGDTTITLEPLRDGFDSCLLDAETFTVSKVLDSAGNSLRFEQRPGTLRVKLSRAYRHRERLSFRVVYHASNVAVDPTKFGMKTGYDLGLGFKVRTERSFSKSARVCSRPHTAPWRGFVTHTFNDKSGPSLLAPPFAGGSAPTRRKETVQWPIKCLSTRRIRRRPGWSCYAATALRNSISKPPTASSSAATSISPR